VNWSDYLGLAVTVDIIASEKDIAHAKAVEEFQKEHPNATPEDWAKFKPVTGAGGYGSAVTNNAVIREAIEGLDKSLANIEEEGVKKAVKYFINEPNKDADLPVSKEEFNKRVAHEKTSKVTLNNIPMRAFPAWVTQQTTRLSRLRVYDYDFIGIAIHGDGKGKVLVSDGQKADQNQLLENIKKTMFRSVVATLTARRPSD
jgi:hypothetical protein